MKRYNEHIIQRIKEYLTGVLDPKGRKALESWHKQDARNREFFERVCRENTISQEDAIYAKTDERKAFRRFQTRVRGKKRTLTRAIGYAAALLLPLAGIALWLKTESLTTAPVPEIAPGSSKAVLTLAGGEQVYLKEGEKHESAKLEKMAVEQREGLLSYKAAKRKEVTKTTEYNTLATGRGGEFRLELSDGTIVYLNASTTLRYPVAFGDGKRAAAISFCRTFVFMAASIEILPQFLGDLGLWLSVPAAEILAFCVSVFFIVRNRRRYGYDGSPALKIIEA